MIRACLISAFRLALIKFDAKLVCKVAHTLLDLAFCFNKGFSADIHFHDFVDQHPAFVIISPSSCETTERLNNVHGLITLIDVLILV